MHLVRTDLSAEKGAFFMENDEYYNLRVYKNQKDKKWLAGYIYLIDYGDGKTFKIGYTTISPEKRLKQICGKTSVIMPMKLVLFGETETNCIHLESLLHMVFDKNHVNGEWFRFEFPDLVSFFIALNSFCNNVHIEDRWFEILPKDAKEWVEFLEIKLPIYTLSREDYYNFFNFEGFLCKTVG